MKQSLFNQNLGSKLALVAAVLVVLAGLAAAPAAAQKTGNMSTPILSCGGGTTAKSIDVVFTAGSPTGAPAGFSLQWMTYADFVANGNQWFLSSDPNLCKGSFSGNAFGYFFNIPANTSTHLLVGETLFDIDPSVAGVSTNCDVALKCGTEYVFRAFAHANSKFKRSDFSATLKCKTLACSADDGCTYTQGHWKTHGPATQCQKGNNSNEWPVDNLDLGDPATNYTESQLCSILWTQGTKGNRLPALAHQLIAAKLNVENGANPNSPYDIQSVIDAADALIGDKVVPPVGAGFLSSSANIDELTAWNEGKTGPGACDDNDGGEE